MAKKTEYVTDDELTNAVSGLLSNVPQLQALRDCEVVILCCMKVRMDDDGETEPPKGSPVKLKKLSDVDRLFAEGNAHYILTMDYHFWKHATEKQQMAKLFDELMDIKPEPTEAGLKLKKREASVDVKHVETLELFGAFDEPTLLVRDAMKNVGKRLKDFVDDFVPAPPPAADEPAVNNSEPEAGEPAGEPEPEPEPEPQPAPKAKGKPAVKK